MKDQIFKTQPFEHQMKALLASRDERFYALLMEMGTGKTKVAIDTTAWLFGKGEINGLVIVAPKSICRNWADKEIPTHLPDHVERRTVLWGPQTVKFAREMATIGQVEPLKLHIFVINIEAIGTDRGYEALESFLRGHHALMVVDEASVIKSPKADRSKICAKLGKLARYRRILTGTPVTQSPLDVFMPFEFLQPGCLGNSSFFGFRNQYAVLQKKYVNGRSFDVVVGYQRLEELKAAIGRYSYRVLKRDCLDLPDKIYQVRYVEQTAEQKKYYSQLKEDALAVLGNGDVVAAPLVLTQLLRLRQALCNIAPKVDPNLETEEWLDGGRYGDTQVISEKDPRQAEVMALLEEAGDQKVIIWANFVPTIARLRAAIAKEYGEDSVATISGAVKQEDRQAAVTRFQDPASKLRFIVAQTRTGGYGLTLTAATLVIYHDNDWSLEVRQQSEDRAHRIGQKSAVTYVDLVAPGTIDEKIRDALVNKRDLADKVTGDRLRELLTE